MFSENIAYISTLVSTSIAALVGNVDATVGGVRSTNGGTV